MESEEETQDYVRERLAYEELGQEEADEIGFVLIALSEPRRAIYWCDNRCSGKALGYMQIASMVVEEGGEARTTTLCKRCFYEKLVQQGNTPLKSMERDCGKKGSSWQIMEDFRK